MLEFWLRPIALTGLEAIYLFYAASLICAAALHWAGRRKLVSRRVVVFGIWMLLGIPLAIAPGILSNPTTEASLFFVAFGIPACLVAFGPMGIPFGVLGLVADRLLPRILAASGSKLKILGCGAHGSDAAIQLRQLAIDHKPQLPKTLQTIRSFRFAAVAIAVCLPLLGSCSWVGLVSEVYLSSPLGQAFEVVTLWPVMSLEQSLRSLQGKSRVQTQHDASGARYAHVVSAP